MNILIGADIVPTSSNIDFFISGNAQSLLGDELNKIILDSDFRIFNLEAPLTDLEKPIPKCGPNLIAPTKCVAGYKAMQIDLLTLANNHILDQDQQGLESTCKVLAAAGIAYTGVGQTPEEAAKPYIYECDGRKIGVYACTEHEFSIVTKHSSGANPIDLLESPDHISVLKAKCDYVIVLYHGGKEHYRYPSPNLQRTCRKLVEKGADLVVCQHSHCIGCEEKYLGGTIVYGQGNFIFDMSEADEWQTSLLIKVVDGVVSYIPIKKHKEKIRIANSIEGAEILDDFRKRSEEIKDAQLIEDKYKDFVSKKLYEYLWVLSGANNSKILRARNKISGYRFYRLFLERKYSAYNFLSMLNYFECEAHREVIIEGLKNV